MENNPKKMSIFWDAVKASLVSICRKIIDLKKNQALENKPKKEVQKIISPEPKKEKAFKFESDPLDELVCTQPFGTRPEYYANLGSPKGHNGLDFRIWPSNNANKWKDVYAVMSGKILEAYEDKKHGKGKFVRIDHGDRGQTVYLHLSSIGVVAGNQIEAGKYIGISGNSGPSDPHLHFSYKLEGFDKKNGYLGCTDPTEYFVGEITYV